MIKEGQPDDWPHPRRRIGEVFNDGDKVVVNLKNRAIKQTDDEEEWYEKAFGSKQNIMTIKIDFTPEVKDAFKKGRNDIYAVIEYNMYDEMQGEFNKADYKVKENVKLDSDKFEISPTDINYMYNAKFEYPYGDIRIELMYDTAGKAEDELDLKPLPEEEKNRNISKDPEPVSLAKLRQHHAEEEEENKRRENEARMAQKKLEEEKARLRYE